MKIIRQYFPYKKNMNILYAEHYAEIPYTDFYEDGKEAYGSEDFSLDRYRKQTAQRYIYRRTSKKNLGGHYIWERIDTLVCRTAADCGRLARMKYPGETLSVRTH